jgi:hypothetical protein
MASRLPSLSLNQAAFSPAPPLLGWFPSTSAIPWTVSSPRHVVFLEDHAALAKLRDCLLQVVGLPRHLRVISGNGPAGLEERELAITAPVTKPARPLLDGLKAQLLGIKRSGPPEILGRNP